MLALDLQIVKARYPELYEPLRRLQVGLNGLQAHDGADPYPSQKQTPGGNVNQPTQPGPISVTSQGRTLLVIIKSPPTVTAQKIGSALVVPLLYSIEISKKKDFSDATTGMITRFVDVSFGADVSQHITVPAGIWYVRVRAKHPESNYGNYSYFGTAANPTAVNTNIPIQVQGIASNPSTSSLTPVLLPDLTATINATGVPLLLLATVALRTNNTGGTAFFQFFKDGSAIGIAAFGTSPNNVAQNTTVSFGWIDSPTAGMHTYQVDWWVSAAGVTVTSDQTNRVFQGIELS